MRGVFSLWTFFGHAIELNCSQFRSGLFSAKGTFLCQFRCNVSPRASRNPGTWRPFQRSPRRGGSRARAVRSASLDRWFPRIGRAASNAINTTCCGILATQHGIRAVPFGRRCEAFFRGKWRLLLVAGFTKNSGARRQTSESSRIQLRKMLHCVARWGCGGVGHPGLHSAVPLGLEQRPDVTPLRTTHSPPSHNTPGPWRGP